MKQKTKKTVKTATSSGVSIGAILWVVLIILKAFAVIEMGWFLVLTSIFWIPVATILAILLGCGAVMGLVFLGVWLFGRFFD
jgi:hypothetical protein